MNVYRVLHTLSVYPSFRPMKMPEIPIICLFILYKHQTVLYILPFIRKKASLSVIVLCLCRKTRLNTKTTRSPPSLASLRSLRASISSLRASISHERFYLASNLYLSHDHVLTIRDVLFQYKL